MTSPYNTESCYTFAIHCTERITTHEDSSHSVPDTTFRHLARAAGRAGLRDGLRRLRLIGYDVPRRGDSSLWFDVADQGRFHHIALGADSIAEVDAAASWLVGRGMTPQCGPQYRPEFASGPDQCYYHVMVRIDDIELEIVYTTGL